MAVINVEEDIIVFPITKRLFYATFGVQSAFAKKYAEIEVRGNAATDFEGIARQVMHENFSGKWAFIYTEREFPDVKKQWGYTALCLIKRDEWGHYRAC